MYATINQFLAEHYAAICALMERAATHAGGHYAEMTAGQRRVNAENDTHEFIQALTQGWINRAAVQATGAQPTHQGLIADDLLRLTSLFQPWMEEYTCYALAGQPALRDQLLQRIQEVNTSFRANLFGTKIDQAITRNARPPVNQAR